MTHQSANDHILYFAYGSSVSTMQMNTRKIDPCKSTVGFIVNYKFAYNKEAPIGARANIMECFGARTYGVCYEIERQKLEQLKSEFEAGYKLIDVTFHTSDGRQLQGVKALKSDLICHEPPPKWYAQVILHAAKDHGLPEEFFHEYAAWRELHD